MAGLTRLSRGASASRLCLLSGHASGPHSPLRRAGRRCAARHFSLVELLIVLLVIAAVAGLAVQLTGTTESKARERTTRASLLEIREAIAAYSRDQADNALPTTLNDLYEAPGGATYDPATKIGWNGPYLRHTGDTYFVDAAAGFTAAYGTVGEPTCFDGWRHPVVLQRPTGVSGISAEDLTRYARLVSAGPDGVLNCPADMRIPDPNARGDDDVLFLRVSDLPPGQELP